MLIQRFLLLLHYIIINIYLFTFTWYTIKLLIDSLIIHSFYILPTSIFDSYRFQSKGQFSAILVIKLEYVDLRPFFKAKFIACIYCIFATKMINMSYMCNRKKKHVAMLTGGIKKFPSPCTA